MNLYIDNCLIDIKIEEKDNFKKIIDSVNEFLKSEKQVIFEIYLNGEKLEKIDDNLPIKKIESLEVFTKNPKVLLLESLQEMNSYLNRFLSGVSEISESFAINDEKTAMQLVIDAISGLEWIYNILLTIKEVSSVDYDKKGFEETFRNFQDILKEILDSLENKDNIMLSDLLEYEVTEIVSEIKEKLPEIYDYILEELKSDSKLA